MVGFVMEGHILQMFLCSPPKMSLSTSKIFDSIEKTVSAAADDGWISKAILQASDQQRS